MAVNLGASTVKLLTSFLEPMIDRAVQRVLDRLDAETAPAAPSASTCVVTVTSTDGTAFRFNAAAAAVNGRAMAEVPGFPTLRLVVDLWSGGADVAPRNDVAMRAGPGSVTFSLAVDLDGKRVLDQQDVTLGFGQGELFAVGKPWGYTPPNTESLIAKGLVPRYAMGPVAAERLDRWSKTMADPQWNALGSPRGIATDMTATGGREDIGPTTTAQAAYLVSGDPVALAYLIGQAEAAIRVPWHLWDAAKGAWLSAEDYPDLWSDPRGKLPVQLSRDGWTIDSAHQPDLCFVAWLLTGRRVFLDGVRSQAAWNVLNQWPDGGQRHGGLIVVDGGQVRHSAWALRQIDEAAYLSPEGSYMRRVSDANWRWLVAQLPAWTKAQGEAFGRIPGDYGTPGATPPWQQDYFASTALAAARRGNPDALTVLRWMRNFLVGRFAKLGHDGCAYLLATGTETTWAGIKAATVAANASNGDGWAHTDGDYAQLARFSLLGIADVLKDAEAKQWADWLVSEQAPYVSAADYVREPTLRVQ